MKTIAHEWKHWAALQIRVFHVTELITVKDDITLQFSWCSEVRKQHSNVAWLAFQRLTFDRRVRMPC